MHIHHNPMTSGNAGIHSAAAAEKAASTQRAAETRRKLLKGAAQIKGGVDGTLDAGAILMVGRWSEGNAGRREAQSRRQQHDVNTAEEGVGVTPISVWA